MDTEKITALLRALELGSLSAAAEQLGYTPLGISRMMASLESEAGFPLLIRAREGVRPTRECERLLPHFRALTAEAARTRAVADALRGVESGEVYVGTPYPTFFAPLSRLMAAFSARYPNVHLGLLEGQSTELACAVEQRRADFCIISRRDGDFDWTPLLDDPLVAVVSAEHPLNGKPAVTADDLRREPFIMMYPEVETDCSLYLESAAVAPDVRFSCRDTYAVYYMVEAGLGVTVDNGIFAAQFQNGVRMLPLEPPRSIQIGVATPRRDRLSPAAQRFSEMAKEFF